MKGRADEGEGQSKQQVLCSVCGYSVYCVDIWVIGA